MTLPEEDEAILSLHENNIQITLLELGTKKSRYESSSSGRRQFRSKLEESNYHRYDSLHLEKLHKCFKFPRKALCLQEKVYQETPGLQKNSSRKAPSFQTSTSSATKAVNSIEWSEV